jgi:D-alanyl-lipoteichoic acid acyltransferase DltB (MBOAT superfamily)
MLFNSYAFIFIFLPISFGVYFYLNHLRLTTAAKGSLVFASLFFYSWWNVLYLPLLLGSMLFNFIIGKSLGEARRVRPKTLLSIGIIGNLALLGYFKYADFFIANVNVLLGEETLPSLNLALPLAISFFTFQQIAYLVDSYKGETNEYDFLNYAVFVSFFPQLIAGPIVHHKEMMPQFASRWNKVKNYRNIALGLFIFSIGLFKKVVIADTFAIWATNGFDKAEILTFFEAWATSLSYTFQLYFDFSGYTDMAIGAALLFNIKLPINFNSPYKALDIQDFWRRWHITLSRFLRDYVYIPLGGNRHGEYRTYTNLFATFLLGGLWHGAGWTFVIWGALHGLAMVVHRAWSNLGIVLWKPLAWLVTFMFINLTWVFFRATSFEDAWKVLKGMGGVSGVVLHPMFESRLGFLVEYGIEFQGMFENISGNRWIVLQLLIALVLVLGFKNSNEKLLSLKFNLRTAVFVSLVFSFGILSLTRVSEFLYFNF